jgi:hypothetical protein
MLLVTTTGTALLGLYLGTCRQIALVGSRRKGVRLLLAAAVGAVAGVAAEAQLDMLLNGVATEAELDANAAAHFAWSLL